MPVREPFAPAFMQAMVLTPFWRVDDNPTPLDPVDLPGQVPEPGEILVRVTTGALCRTEPMTAPEAYAHAIPDALTALVSHPDCAGAMSHTPDTRFCRLADARVALRELKHRQIHRANIPQVTW
jgi:hypothetical protein